MVTRLLEMYRLSKDVNHASGYNFNSSPGVLDFYSHYAIFAVFAWLKNLVINANLVVEERDHKTKHIKDVLDYLKMFMRFEDESMKSIGRKYQEDYNKYSNHET